MAIGARPRPSVADAAGGAGGLADRPGGRVAVEARNSLADRRGDVDALSVRAHRHRVWESEPMAIGAPPRPGLADAACGPGGLADRAGGRVAGKARYCVAVRRGDVD